MATSEGNFPLQATSIDELTLSDHYYLDEDDSCMFIGEYTSSAGYQHSATNQLIINLKKGMDRRNQPEWRYKEAAILQAAQTIEGVLNESALNEFTFVPIPPSKVRGDPDHDDRMLRMVQAIRPSKPVDARELIIQTESTDAIHTSRNRLAPDEIEALYRIDEGQVLPAPAAIILVDDMLTTGAHFKAAQSVLRKQFPGVPVYGLFVARRALSQNDDFEPIPD
ncbi:MAG: hypothetical protein OXC84_07830 [Gammaproteobacteria bacterium]|nr:hypothetical protein [Gammaproteobacteria bacterium]